MVLGLTGPTGAGKSSVCDVFRDRQGIQVIDCDQVARDVVARGKECLLDLAVAFSPVILNPDGTLNRRRLAKLVFSDPEKRRQLNGIIFPHILGEVTQKLEEARRSGAKAAVLDAPTLFESGADALCDRIVVVTASPSLRQFRIMNRDHLSLQEAQDRMNSQPDESFYCDRADYVLHNDQDTAALRLAVLELMNQWSL